MGSFSPDPAADRLARRALAASAALHDELQAAVRRRLNRLPARAPASDVLDAARHVIIDFTGPLASLLGDAMLAAWLVGGGGVAGELPGDVSPLLASPGSAGGLPPPFGPPPGAAAAPWEWDGSPVWLPVVEAAVEDLRSRNLVTRDEWDRLSAELRRRAFTVAGLEAAEAVGAVRDAVAGAVEAGAGLAAFKKAVAEAIGETALSPAAAEGVFRTNVGQAYANGVEQLGREPVVRDLYPYRARIVTPDSRLSEICATLAVSGLQRTNVYRADDPSWIKYRPLSHPNCRCGIRLMSVADAAERGVREAIRWLRTGDPPDVPEWVPEPNVRLPNGWAQD